ncbi:hypothetical protein [Candidatus Nitrosocosmicus sp. T]
MTDSNHQYPSSNLFIIYCTLAGFFAAWGISGLLVIMDLISQTPPSSFFGAIGISLGYYAPVSAALIGFGLYILTGTIAGNIFGQVSLFWKRISPNNSKHGSKTGMMVSTLLWAVLFVPVTVLVIQPMLYSFNTGTTPNQYVYSIASNFGHLFGIILFGSLIFHLIYGALLGFMAGKMMEIKAFSLPKTV